jgi:hypothetical protein
MNWKRGATTEARQGRNKQHNQGPRIHRSDDNDVREKNKDHRATSRGAKHNSATWD